jgi:hypothetical protein
MSNFKNTHPVACAACEGVVTGTVASVVCPLVAPFTPMGVAFIAAAAVLVGACLPDLDVAESVKEVRRRHQRNLQINDRK